METWYQVAMPEMWWLHRNRLWRESMVIQNIACSICHRVLRKLFPQTIDVVFDKDIEKSRVHDVDVSGIALIRKDLLDVLLPYMQDISIGRAIYGKNHVSTQHVVFYSSWSACVDSRHYPPREVRPCAECGTIRCYGKTTKPSYLLEYDIKNRMAVVSRSGELFISNKVKTNIDIRLFKPMYFQEIEVKHAPHDGLRFPTDPDWVQGRDATVPWREGEP